MDWYRKFDTVLEETERNISKAKEKLLKNKDLTKHEKQSSLLGRADHETFYAVDSNIAWAAPTVMSSSPRNSSHLWQLQDQIQVQNKTIEKLQDLIQTIDSERNYYKDQIYGLRAEIDIISDKLRFESTSNTSQNQLSRVKQQLSTEIEKLRTLVKNQGKDKPLRLSASSRLESELSSMKEQLLDGLDHCETEINLIKSRLDYLESIPHIDSDWQNLERPPSAPEMKNNEPSRPDFRTTYIPRESNDSMLQDLKNLIFRLSTKLDGLENRISLSTIQNPNYNRASYPWIKNREDSSNQRDSRLLPTEPDSYFHSHELDLDDLSSISGLSEISSIDCDFELDLEPHVNKKIHRTYKSTIYKNSSQDKEPEELDLSDLDLSDVEELADDDENLDLKL